jgi:hypothetical protein
MNNMTPEEAYNFVVNLGLSRDQRSEKIIMKDPMRACLYANGVIKGRWPEAELVIMKYPYCAYWYARNIIKGRWPEAEPLIMKHSRWWGRYKMHFNIDE